MQKKLIILCALLSILMFLLMATFAGTKYFPIEIIMTIPGIILGLSVSENRLWLFTKKGVLSVLVFCLIYGLIFGAFFPDNEPEHKITLWNNVRTFVFIGVFSLPFSLVGLYMGMIIKGLGQHLKIIKY